MACFTSDKALSIDKTPSSGPSPARISANISLLSTSACFCRQVHLCMDDNFGYALPLGFTGADLFTMGSSRFTGAEGDEIDSELAWECVLWIVFGRTSSTIVF